MTFLIAACNNEEARTVPKEKIEVSISTETQAKIEIIKQQEKEGKLSKEESLKRMDEIVNPK